jgi:hypothetical protein
LQKAKNDRVADEKKWMLHKLNNMRRENEFKDYRLLNTENLKEIHLEAYNNLIERQRRGLMDPPMFPPWMKPFRV